MKENRYVFCRFWIALAMAGFGMLANADSSVPPLINYQGQLTDASGNPQTGTKKLEFNIYDASTGGNKIWGPQTFIAVPLIGGRFNVMLGSTDAGGNSISAAFGASSRFLGIKVDSGPEISPRQQILSTPFAIQSDHAMRSDRSTLADRSSQADNSSRADVSDTIRGNQIFVDPNTGNVGINTKTPTSTLHINGVITLANPQATFVLGNWGASTCARDVTPDRGSCPSGYSIIGTGEINFESSVNCQWDSGGDVPRIKLRPVCIKMQ